MQVPEEIGAHRVQAHGLRQLEALPPIFLGHAGRVDLPAADLQPLAVQQEIIGADGEGMRRLRRPPAAGEQPHRQQQSKNTIIHPPIMIPPPGGDNLFFHSA